MADKFGKDAGEREPVSEERISPANEVTDLGHLESTPVPPTNDLALVSFLAGVGGWIVGAVGVCPLLQGFNLCFIPVAFIAWAVALFTGFAGRAQIAEGDEEGDDLAVWGLAAGGAGILLGTLLLLVVAILFFVLGVSIWRV